MLQMIGRQGHEGLDWIAIASFHPYAPEDMIQDQLLHETTIIGGVAFGAGRPHWIDRLYSDINADGMNADGMNADDNTAND